MNKIRTILAFPTGVSAGACLAACLVALAGISGAGTVVARQAPTAHGPAIMVLPFDLYDYSLDQRSTTVVPLRHWVAALAGQLAVHLRDDTSFRVINDSAAAAALRKVRVTYPHPTACHACVISIARRSGANLVVIGQVHKLSNLITYFDVRIADVRTGHIVHVIDMRADGADTDSMWRHIARNLADRVEHAIVHAP